MKKTLISTLIINSIGIALFIFPVLAQSKKPEAAVAPIVTLGNIPPAEQKIIFIHLENHLSQYYHLVSQNQFQIAQEEAFETLDSEECTDEQCIRKIQEILQVERLFILQIVREQQITQISLTLVNLDNKLITDDLCEQCDLKQLYEKVEHLVEQLVQQDQEPAIAPSLDQEPAIKEEEKIRQSEIVVIPKFDSSQGREPTNHVIIGISPIPQLGWIVNRSVTVGIEYQDSENKTREGIYLRRFTGKSFNGLFALHRNKIKETETIKDQYLRIGIGNQWTWNIGLVFGIDWAVYAFLLSESDGRATGEGFSYLHVNFGFVF